MVAATALLTVFLMWATAQFQWVGLRAQPSLRVALLAGMLAGSVGIYFGALWAAGMQLRQFVTR